MLQHKDPPNVDAVVEALNNAPEPRPRGNGVDPDFVWWDGFWHGIMLVGLIIAAGVATFL